VTLAQPGVARFWLAVILTGLGAGIGAIVLTDPCSKQPSI
jgi:hypothetical protein